MTTDIGRSGAGAPSGSRPTDGAASVSTADAASIPNAQVSCIICTRRLRSFDTRTNHPMGGIEFTTPGHYGTAAFDPMNGDRLAINICDWCVVEFGRAGAILFYQQGKRRPKRWRVPPHIVRNIKEKYLPASAIEAQRAETAETGSVADEGAASEAGDAR